MPVEQKSVLEYPEILIFAWGHTIPMIADAVGVELDRIDTSYEKWAATEPIEFPHGVIAPGECAAVRFEIRGWVGDEAKIVIEHVNRITNAAAPDWPRVSSMDNDVYRKEITGSPNIVQENAFRNEGDDDPIAGGCLATGMRAINAIPYLDALQPGLVTALDLPLIPGRGTLRAVPDESSGDRRVRQRRAVRGVGAARSWARCAHACTRFGAGTEARAAVRW